MYDKLVLISTGQLEVRWQGLERGDCESLATLSNGLMNSITEFLDNSNHLMDGLCIIIHKGGRDPYELLHIDS